jgi:hypothetical protein
MIEDEESIQYALMEVINALMRNTIDVKRASLIIRALHIAVKNAARVKFGIHAKDTVTQVPEYAPPTEQHEAIAQQSELPAVSAIPTNPSSPPIPTSGSTAKKVLASWPARPKPAKPPRKHMWGQPRSAVQRRRSLARV